MRLRWTPDAAKDLESIYEYIVSVRPARARVAVTAMYIDLLHLRKFPGLGRPIPGSVIREYFLSPHPYVCTYKLTETAVILLRIHHTAQDRSALGPR